MKKTKCPRCSRPTWPKRSICSQCNRDKQRMEAKISSNHLRCLFCEHIIKDKITKINIDDDPLTYFPTDDIIVVGVWGTKSFICCNKCYKQLTNLFPYIAGDFTIPSKPAEVCRICHLPIIQKSSIENMCSKCCGIRGRHKQIIFRESESGETRCFSCGKVYPLDNINLIVNYKKSRHIWLCQDCQNVTTL